jgi:hypothetical protein
LHARMCLRTAMYFVDSSEACGCFPLMRRGLGKDRWLAGSCWTNYRYAAHLERVSRLHSFRICIVQWIRGGDLLHIWREPAGGSISKQVGRGLDAYRQIKGQDSVSLIGIQTWYTSLLETRHSGINCSFAVFNGSVSVCVIELSVVWDCQITFVPRTSRVQPQPQNIVYSESVIDK